MRTPRGTNSYTVLPRPLQGTSAPKRWETYAHTKRVRECSQQPHSYKPKSGNQLVKEETRCGLSTRRILLSHKRKSSHNATQGTWKHHRTQTPSHVSRVPGRGAGCPSGADPWFLVPPAQGGPHDGPATQKPYTRLLPSLGLGVLSNQN